MSEHLAREIALKVRQGLRRVVRNATRQYTDDAGRLKLGGGGKTGVIQPVYGGTGHAGGAEPPLPTPPGPGYLLTSGPGGTYTWRQLIAGAGITVSVNTTTGAITIGQTLTLDTVIWDGDDVIWGGDLVGWGDS